MRLGLPIAVMVLVGGVLVGCSAKDWQEWKSHSTHFASGDHMAFSLKNQGKTPHVKASDSQLSASQSWWGDPVVVRADQIFQD